MRRKIIEWTIFAAVAAGAVLFVRWFVPRAAFLYYRAAIKPAPLQIDLVLRKRLRAAENALADKRTASARALSGSGQAMPCLVVPVSTGVGTPQGTRPGVPVRDCPELIPGGPPFNGVEMNLRTGNLLFVQTDLFLPGNPPIAFTRVVERFRGWNHRFRIFLQNEYDMFPFGHRNPYTYVKFQLADRRQFLFQRISKGTGYADAVFEREARGSIFYRALVGWNGDGWDMDLPDGRTLVFPDSYSARRPSQGAIGGLMEPSGASLSFARDRDGNLHSVRSSDGRWMKLGYRGPLIVSMEDSSGEKANFSYGKDNLLASSTNAKGQTLSYTYNERGQLVEVRNTTTGKPVFQTHYGGLGVITSLRVAGIGTFGFSYRVDPTGSYPETDISEGGVGQWSVLLRSCTASGCAYEVIHR